MSAGLGIACTALRATSLCVRYWLGGNVIGVTQAWLVTGDLSYLGHAEVTSARWDRDTAVRAAVPHSSGIYTCFSVLCTRLRVRVRLGLTNYVDFKMTGLSIEPRSSQ